MPLDLGFANGGVHAYGEIDDTFSYYRGLHPSHQLLELSGDFAAGPWALSPDYMYYHSNGDVQTPGWNRLTQALIDNGTYITGSNTSLQASPAPASLTLNNFGGNPYSFNPNFTPLYIAAPGCGSCTDAAHTLDSGFGTTDLAAAPSISRRAWISPTPSPIPALPNWRAAWTMATRIRLQAFVDTLENDRFVSYGFPGSYRTQIGETRARYDFRATL